MTTLHSREAQMFFDAFGHFNLPAAQTLTVENFQAYADHMQLSHSDIFAGIDEGIAGGWLKVTDYGGYYLV
jgi:hypothetical protein